MIAKIMMTLTLLGIVLSHSALVAVAADENTATASTSSTDQWLGVGASAGFYQIDTADDHFGMLSFPRISATFLTYFDAEFAVEFRQKDLHFTSGRNKKMNDAQPLYLHINFSLMPEDTLNPFIQAGFDYHRLEMSFENTPGSDSTTALGYHAGIGLRYMIDNTFIDILARYESLMDSKEFSVYNEYVEEYKTGEWTGEDWAILMGVRVFVL